MALLASLSLVSPAIPRGFVYQVLRVVPAFSLFASWEMVPDTFEVHTAERARLQGLVLVAGEEAAMAGSLSRSGWVVMS